MLNFCDDSVVCVYVCVACGRWFLRIWPLTWLYSWSEMNYSPLPLLSQLEELIIKYLISALKPQKQAGKSFTSRQWVALQPLIFLHVWFSTRVRLLLNLYLCSVMLRSWSYVWFRLWEEYTKAKETKIRTVIWACLFSSFIYKQYCSLNNLGS